MREMRRYSEFTVKLVARHVHRALPYIHGDLSRVDKVEHLIAQVIRQGLQPVDLARPSGADALVAIAAALDTTPMRIETGRSSYVPAKLGRAYAPKTVIIDSFSPIEAKTAADWARVDFRAFELRIAAQLAAGKAKLTEPWNRVVERVLRMENS